MNRTPIVLTTLLLTSLPNLTSLYALYSLNYSPLTISYTYRQPPLLFSYAPYTPDIYIVLFRSLVSSYRLASLVDFRDTR